MIRDKSISQPFQTYIEMAEDTFKSITGGPKPRADPPGINIKAVYYPDDFAAKDSVIHCTLELLN
jgi:hypothetical protein